MLVYWFSDGVASRSLKSLEFHRQPWKRWTSVHGSYNCNLYIYILVPSIGYSTYTYRYNLYISIYIYRHTYYVYHMYIRMYFLTPCAFRGDPAAAAVSKFSVSKGCRFTSPLCIVGAGGYIYTYIYIYYVYFISVEIWSSMVLLILAMNG